MQIILLTGLIRHHKAVFHDVSGRWEVRLLTEDEEEKIRELDETKEEYSELWRVFFDSIAIKERENKKLQIENLPIKYRKNMTEFIV